MKFTEVFKDDVASIFHTEYKNVPIFICSNPAGYESAFLNQKGAPGVACFSCDKVEGDFKSIREQPTKPSDLKFIQFFVNRMPLSKRQKDDVANYVFSADSKFQHNALFEKLDYHKIQYVEERILTNQKKDPFIVAFATKDTDLKNSAKNRAILQNEVFRTRCILSGNAWQGVTSGKKTNVCHEIGLNENSSVVAEAVDIINRQMVIPAQKSCRLITIMKNGYESQFGRLYAKDKKESNKIIRQIEEYHKGYYIVTDELNRNNIR